MSEELGRAEGFLPPARDRGRGSGLAGLAEEGRGGLFAVCRAFAARARRGGPGGPPDLSFAPRGAARGARPRRALLAAAPGARAVGASEVECSGRIHDNACRRAVSGGRTRVVDVPTRDPLPEGGHSIRAVTAATEAGGGRGTLRVCRQSRSHEPARIRSAARRIPVPRATAQHRVLSNELSGAVSARSSLQT